VPTVPDDNRLSVSELGSGVRQVIARVGFTENPTTGTPCSRPEWSSETSRRAQPQTPAFGSGLPNAGRVRCPMQPHPIPRGLRDQLNPDNNNLALNPGGLSIRDTPPPGVRLWARTASTPKDSRPSRFFSWRDPRSSHRRCRRNGQRMTQKQTRGTKRPREPALRSNSETLTAW